MLMHPFAPSQRLLLVGRNPAACNLDRKDWNFSVPTDKRIVDMALGLRAMSYRSLDKLVCHVVPLARWIADTLIWDGSTKKSVCVDCLPNGKSNLPIRDLEQWNGAKQFNGFVSSIPVFFSLIRPQFVPGAHLQSSPKVKHSTQHDTEAPDLFGSQLRGLKHSLSVHLPPHGESASGNRDDRADSLRPSRQLVVSFQPRGQRNPANDSADDHRGGRPDPKHRQSVHHHLRYLEAAV